MQTTLYIIGFFLLGSLARKYISDPSRVVGWMNTYIIYLAMPSIILLKIPALSFDSQMLIPAGFAWAWAAIGCILMLCISRIFKFPKPLEGAVILLTVLGNTSFLGYPMVQAYFSDEVLNYAIIYDQVGSFLMLSTVGVVIISLYSPSSSGNTVSLLSVLKKVLSFPPFIALLVAAMLPKQPFAVDLAMTLTLLGSTLMPVALVVIGLQFQPQLLPEHRVPLGAAVTTKMILAPMLAYAALNCLNTSEAVMQATIFESAMPSMITPGIMAIQAGLAPRFCATLLGYSTLFSFAWLPLIAAIIH